MTNPQLLESSQRVAALADALLDESRQLYGVPSGMDDPRYGDFRSYLTGLDRHDFRIAEMTQVLPSGFLDSPRRVLDLGSGPGIFTLRMRGMGHDAYGVDLDRRKIDLAHAHIEALGIDPTFRDRISVADAGQLPYENEKFDLLSTYHVVEHVSDLRSVLYEAVRVTKRGGFLHIQAPDYRFSYDTHYCMPWPRMMPPAQAHAWCLAMGRPTGGIETIYRVTAPEVTAIVEALGCRIHVLLMREHRDGRIHAHDGTIPTDPILLPPGVDVSSIAQEIKRLAQQSQLPNIYRTCLEFTIIAQRA